MPSVFKALASITAWALFICGWLQLLGGAWGYFYSCYITGSVGVVAVSTRVLAVWGLGTGSLILSVCAMKLRQMLD
ncbi:hypothetical protein ES703_78469 [subsurface metagenome]